MTSFGDSFPLGLIADAQIKNDGPCKSTIIPPKKHRSARAHHPVPPAMFHLLSAETRHILLQK